jgi:pimeloyl-ACP methyl ester carboxylesterase
MSPPASRRLALGTGLSVHLLEWGEEDPGLDHTVILVHGFLDHGWGWARTVEAGLAGRFHVIAPDMRGHGDSDRVGAGGYYHFLDYLADLHELVGAVGRRRVSLVGHSMGGGIASYYAGAFPDRIHRLALLEGTGPPEVAMAAPARIAAWLAGWRRVRERPGRTYGSIEEAAARLRESDPLLEEGLARELAARGTATGPDGRLRFKHDPLHLTLGPYPFRVDAAAELWRNVRCPVLLVEGGASVFRHAPEERARRHACFADRREALLDGAGHMMQRHRPAELAALLAPFLAGG